MRNFCYGKLKGYPFVVWISIQYGDKFVVNHPLQKRFVRSKTYTNWYNGKVMCSCNADPKDIKSFKKCPRKFKKLIYK